MRPDAVRSALRKNRGGRPVGVARHLGAADSARRKMEVSSVYGIREGGRGRSLVWFLPHSQKRRIRVAWKQTFLSSGWPYGVSVR